MPLPILKVTHAASSDDLLRLFHRTELHWTRHLGEETQLDVGTAFTNPELPRVWNANRVLDAALPAGVTPSEAVGEVEQHFAAQGLRCHQWIMNPAAPREQTAPLVEHLLTAGWRAEPADVLHLRSTTIARAAELPGITVIPARASFRHARQLHEERSTEWNEPQLVEAAMAHLDDPHWDALLALRDGAAAGGAGVLAVGDIGRIDQVYVSTRCRHQGIGRMLMQRVLETCARSLFKHVMLSCLPDHAPASTLYGQLGFQRIGQIVTYNAPS